MDKEKGDLEEYKEILSSDNIKLWLKWGSKFETTFPLIKARYVFSEGIDPIDFLYLLQEGRKTWDKNVLLLEEVTKLSHEASIIRYAMKAPIYFMKAKDFVEKRIKFSENGVYYGYSSSIPNGVLPTTDQYQRCETIFGGSVLVQEGPNYVYYTFSQIDLKVFHTAIFV